MKSDTKHLGEILKSLKQQATPWSVKVKNVHQLMDVNCKFPCKNQIILEWACQELVFNSKNNCYPEEMLKELWQIITEILKVIIAEGNTNTVLLRPSFIELLVHEFQSTKCPNAPLVQCCKILFATPELYRSSAMKYDKFVQFLKSALKFVPVFYHMTTSCDTVAMQLTSYCQLIEVLLQLYLKLQKQQTSLQKVAIVFNERLLPEIAVWNRVLSKFGERTDSRLQKIHSKDILQQTLWNSEAMSGIKGHAHLFGKSEMKEDNSSRNFAMLDSLFSTIETSVVDESSEFTRSAVLYFIPELFQTFLTASSESKTLPKHFEFTMFRQLCSAVLKSEAIRATNAIDSTVCIRQLLKGVLDFRVFLVIDETVNTDMNRRLLHSLTERILQKIDCGSEELTIIALNCLEHLVEIDLSLLERQLEQIIKALLTSGEASEDRSTLKEAKGNLLGVIFETYSKVRRTEDFVKILISAVLNCDRSIHSDSIFLNWVKNSSIGLPVAQSLTIIKLLLEDLKNNYISKQCDFQPSVTGRKSFNEIICKTAFLAKLVSILFNNVRILPSNGYHGEKQERFVDMVGNIKEDIILPLIHVLQEATDETVRCNLSRIIWQFVSTFQSLVLYLIDHGFLSSPLLHLFNSRGEVLLPAPSKNTTVVDYSHFEDWRFHVEGLLFYTRQLIITLDSIQCRRCIAYIEQLIAYLASIGGQPTSSEWTVKLGGIFVNELPWLGDFVSMACMRHLCKMFLNAICSHIEIRDEGLMQNLQLPRRSRDPDKTYSKPRLSPEEHRGLLAEPCFYDNRAMQTAFCDCLVHNISITNVWNDISVAFERLIEIADVNENGIEQMEVDDLFVVEGHFPSAATGHESTNPLLENSDTSLSWACNDVLKLILRWNDKLLALRDDGSFCQSVPPVALMTECCRLLEVMNMVIFEWLIPSSAAKLLLLILLIGRQYTLFENGLWRVEMQRATFYLLEKFTGSTIVANRMAVWEVVDPVLLLKCVLTMIHDYVKQEGDMPHSAYNCAQSLWMIVLRTKRNKPNDDEVFDKLKNEMLLITEEMSNNLTLVSVKILNTLLCGTLETMQTRVVKKQCFVTASQLTFPIVERMLSVDLDAMLNKHDIEICRKIDDNGKMNEHEQIYYSTLRSYGYVFSICLHMKSSGKDQEFISMLSKFKLEDLISTSAIAVQRGFSHMKANVNESELFVLREEVCLEYLKTLYGHKDSADTSELRNKNFCEQLFACLISIVEEKWLKQFKSKNLNAYFEIIACCVKVTSCDVSYNIFQLAYRHLVSVMHDSNLVELSLELLDYLFSTTYTKDRKNSIANLLPKVLYLLLEIAAKTIDERVLAKAFKSLVSLLAFSKSRAIFINDTAKVVDYWRNSRPGVENLIRFDHTVMDILAPVHASAALHCMLNPARSSPTSNCYLELLLIKIKLLSVLLFNHKNGMLGAIASFGSAVDSILQEFAILNKTEKHGTEDVIKACNGISRLYKEIASHKESIAEFARYFLADYVRMIAKNTIQKDCQEHLSSGIYCLMDICPTEDFTFLNTVLSQREQDLFKDLHASFKKYYKFQGKT